MSIAENVALGWWTENHRGLVLNRRAMDARALAVLEREGETAKVEIAYFFPELNVFSGR